MKRQLYIITFIAALFFVACEEVIEIDLNSAAPVIVAEGAIGNDTSAWLKLSYTTDYFALEESQNISDAVVEISDSEGNIEVMSATGNGQYEAPLFTAVIGRTYTISFTVDGQVYEASSKLMSPTKIKTVSFEAMEMGMREQIQGVEYFMPTLVIADNAAEENYYNFVFYVDGEKQDGFFLTTDRGTKDGKLTYTPLRMPIEGGNEVRVEAYSIDKDTYAYYSQLDDLSGDMMDSSTPYNAKSNFGTEVMGFFSALSKDTYIGMIE